MFTGRFFVCFIILIQYQQALLPSELKRLYCCKLKIYH